MNKNIIALGLITISGFAFGQMKYEAVSDTARIQQIEDVLLHKTGNPNKAKPLSSKANLTMMETPQPIAIVTHEVIEEQQAKQLSDVLQNVNGVYITSSRGNSQDSFGGRGFILGNDNIFKNGSRVNSGVFPEVSGLERVEVLKGANAMMYGNTAAGGVINMITKKPRFHFGGSASMNVGSWNSYKPTVDVYGPLSKNVAARINMAYEHADSFRDIVSSDKFYVNPSFIFNLGEKSQLIVEADYLKNDSTPDFGIGSIINTDKSYKLNDMLPINAFLGTPWQYQNVQQTSTTVTYKRQLSDKWTLDAIASYQNYTKDYFSTERVSWETTADNRYRYKRNLSKTYSEQNYGSIQVNLNGEFNTGKIGHKVLIGADGDFGQSDSFTFFNPANNKEYGTSYIYGNNGSPTDLLYLDDPSTWVSGTMPDSKTFGKTRTTSRRLGVYAQDFISLSKTFKVIAGLRWSYVENMPSLKTQYAVAGKAYGKTIVKNSQTSDQAISPKLGLVYMPNDNLSIFATYTNSFSNNVGIDINNEGLKPTNIDQYEVGAKKNFWNNAVALNLSVYQIIYQNYYQNALDENGNQIDPSGMLKEYSGKMRSRGVELDITGNPTPNLSIIGGFSYNNAVYLDTPETTGYVEKQRLVRTPATTANLSVFYKFTDQLKGLKLGAGAYYIGDRLAGWNDTKNGGSSSLDGRNGVSRIFELKDYTTVYFSAGYEWKKFMIQAKVNNIFDVVNYNVHENYSVNPIAPRNFYVTLTYKL